MYRKISTLVFLFLIAGSLVSIHFVQAQTTNRVGKATPTPTSVNKNSVPNSSLEQASASNPNQPQDWTTDSWGTNTAEFTYLNTGHTGSHSVETQITSYTDGDAKWYYTPQSTPSNASYRFTDYYESNIASYVEVMVTKTDGSVEYINLQHAEPASTWTQYTDTFTTPPNTKTITVLHLIHAVGYVITDDYSVTPYTPVGFKRALVSITFDDGWQSQYTNGLPLLNKYKVKGTFYLVPGFMNTPNYVTTSQAQAIQKAGNQIGSHTMDHPDLTTLSSTQVTNELAQSQQTLQATFGPIKDFASPYGAYNSQVVALIKNYYRSHRSTDAGYNSKDNFNIYNIRAQVVVSTTSIAEIDSWIDQAQQHNTWLVLLFHEINTNGDDYCITPQNFGSVLSYINSKGLTTLTVDQALSEVVPQVQ